MGGETEKALHGAAGPVFTGLLDLLSAMVREEASDLFLIAGAPPTVRRHGDYLALKHPVLAGPDIQAFAASVMSAAQAEVFENRKECDLALQVPGTGRFRINVHMQRGQPGMVVRYVSSHIASIEALGLPPAVQQLAFLKRGLVLAVGAAGAGKTTTLAALLDHRNARIPGHILTIEDPIEYVHTHQRSLVTQREVGLDTLSYDEALRHAMREAPSVIMIGEIRDRETMQHAMHYAESGHLCVSTLHANNASQSIQRILNFFPETAHAQILLDLSLNLKAVIAQRLLPGLQTRQVPAVELLLLTNFVADLLQKGQIHEIRTALERSTQVGMCTFDQSLFALFERGAISREEMLAHADNRTDLTLRLRLAAGAPLEVAGMRMADLESNSGRASSPAPLG
ncbi:PilT/PilU family type 4a pilus ATPase [Simplicispira suum]|uniref:Type IV pili twitching motility protein PilT n=1 Tax=Simplicispira suum TaxID=2109915 RepID=A0A2S0N1H7_9BURK|nr:PilT/PilU family type 4a pilus ATPase [Simplicispira suum]AVO41773.1 type IV pili twitching motility protein PilT [Simplicispira suum]